MSDVVLYKCVVCGRAFTKLAALRGHLRIHKDVKWENFTVRLPKVMCDAFREEVKSHNTTTCQVVHSLMGLWTEGAKRGLVDLSTPNPVTLQLVNIFNARPRGHGKYNVTGLGGPGTLPYVLCDFYGGIRPGEVYCRWRGLYSWVPWDRCESCQKNRAKQL